VRINYGKNAGLQRTGFLQSDFFMAFSIHRKFFGLAITWFFMVSFDCNIIKRRNVTDSSTASLWVADIAGCATWTAGLLAPTLAVGLLLIYDLHRAQHGRNFPSNKASNCFCGLL
jgi:hypothetical protein